MNGNSSDHSESTRPCLVDSRVAFEDLSVTACNTPNDIKIVGCVVNCFPANLNHSYGKLRKIVLKEALSDGTLGDKELSCLLYNHYVDQAISLSVGDCLTVTGFEVSVDTCFSQDIEDTNYPYQIDVIKNEKKPGIIQPILIISEKPVLRFDDLLMISKPYAGICIVGRVIKCENIKKTPEKDTIRKLVLKEILTDGTLGKVSLDCLIYNQLAKQNKTLKEGDTIKLSAFNVEARPSTSALELTQASYPYQVVLLPNENTSKDQYPTLVIIKPTVSNALSSKSSPRKNINYKYTPLKDLELDARNGYSTKERFHVYGVVVRCNILNYRIKECLEVVIRDPSLDHFTVFVYTRPDADSFPDIRPNDIIRLHRMGLEYHHRTLQGYCYSPNDLVVFSGTDPDAAPSHTSRTFTCTKVDQESIAQLREWNKPVSKGSATETSWLSCPKRKRSKLEESSGLSNSRNPVPLKYQNGGNHREESDIGNAQPANHFDKASPVKRLENNKRLKLMDSVEIAKGSESLEVNKNGQFKNPTASLNGHHHDQGHVEETAVIRLNHLVECSPNKNMVNGESHQQAKGSPSITEVNHKSLQEEYSPNENMVNHLSHQKDKCSPNKNMVNHESLQQDKVLPIQNQMNLEASQEELAANIVVKDVELDQDDEHLVKNMPVVNPVRILTRKKFNQVSYDPRILVKDIIQPLNFISTAVSFSSDVTAIRDLENLTSLSRCRVQAAVVDIMPMPQKIVDSICLLCKTCQYLVYKKKAEHLLASDGVKNKYLCPKCPRETVVLEDCFSLMLQLDDGSGKINVYLFGKQAEFFFNGIKASECGKERNVTFLQRLQRKLTRIVYDSTSREKPPVLDCCLFKYRSINGLFFQIVDTKLI